MREMNKICEIQKMKLLSFARCYLIPYQENLNSKILTCTVMVMTTASVHHRIYIFEFSCITHS